MKWEKTCLTVGVGLAVLVLHAVGFAQDEKSASTASDHSGAADASAAKDRSRAQSKQRLRAVLNSLNKNGLADVPVASY